MATKPTKQQVAQAKARAGGNNPVKVTNAGLKKLGSAAVIAASFTPAGRVVKGAATVAKAASGARKASTAAKSFRQAGDYAVSGSRSKLTVPNMKGKSLEISKNVAIKNGMSPSGKVNIRGSVAQVSNQNYRLTAPLSKAEAKGNARGLKAANAKLSKGNAKREYDKDKVNMVQKANPSMSKSEALLWSRHPGYASQKSNTRTVQGKSTSDKQIAKYQKKEIKTFRKRSK